MKNHVRSVTVPLVVQSWCIKSLIYFHPIWSCQNKLTFVLSIQKSLHSQHFTTETQIKPFKAVNNWEPYPWKKKHNCVAIYLASHWCVQKNVRAPYYMRFFTKQHSCKSISEYKDCINSAESLKFKKFS